MTENFKLSDLENFRIRQNGAVELKIREVIETEMKEEFKADKEADQTSR